ncbi:MAG: substrate-binding domain-containing protein [Anaerolineae bacterium]|nr:substrate-binding domain-containing protein [Anaerolineae bacterium]
MQAAASKTLSGMITLYQSGLKKAKHTILLLSLAIAGCRTQIAPASPTPDLASLRLLTDSATAPLLRDLVNHYHPSGVLISWDIEVAEAPTIVNWLKAANSSFALTSFLSNEAIAQNNLWVTPVGQDAVAFIVNTANPVAALSAAELRAILQGRISNWNQLGGADLPITVVARQAESSTGALVQSMVLGERRTTLNARLAAANEDVLELVRSLPGALGYVSMGYVDSSIRVIPLDGIPPTPRTVSANQYPIRAPMLFVGRRPPNDDYYRAFFAWVQSPEGQAIVRQHYGGLSS